MTARRKNNNAAKRSVHKARVNKATIETNINSERAKALSKIPMSEAKVIIVADNVTVKIVNTDKCFIEAETKEVTKND